MEGRDAIGCIVRLTPGSMDSSSIHFECPDLVNIPPPVEEHETLLSHIIKISFEDRELKPKVCGVFKKYHWPIFRFRFQRH